MVEGMIQVKGELTQNLSIHWSKFKSVSYTKEDILEYMATCVFVFIINKTNRVDRQFGHTLTAKCGLEGVYRSTQGEGECKVIIECYTAKNAWVATVC